jgi:hypothetical protein
VYTRQFLVAAISILPAFHATATIAQSSPVGDAASVENQVEGILNRKAQVIPPGGSVFQNERVHTGDASQTQLVFLDHTYLGVGPMSEVTIDRFVYNPDRGTGRVQIEASRGVFRFVTGSQDKKDYAVATPSGTIHVAGTEFHLLVERDYMIVALEHGALTITTNKGRRVALDRPATSMTVHVDGRVDGPSPWTGPITHYAGAPFPYFVSGAPPQMGGPMERSWTGFYASLGGGYAWDGTIVISARGTRGSATQESLAAPMSATIAKSAHS